ncbi:MAG: tetraacyldisaccharide 4'-kinase, partial [Gammaproteobacteria bacterium]|nr:tetraacyldisaccharide 4'-kinase [Gammaproteobacteria bacterium]
MALNNLLNQIWYDKHPAYILLLPLSLIYGLIVAFRKLLYATGIFTVNIMPVPVIV